MFSVTTLFALLQLFSVAVSAIDTSWLRQKDVGLLELRRSGSPKCRRVNQDVWNTWTSESTSSSRWTAVISSTSRPVATSSESSTITTTSNVISSTTTTNIVATTKSASPNCPTIFRLYIEQSSLGRFYISVNSEGSYETIRDQSSASAFLIRNSRLVNLTVAGGAAALPEGTGLDGGYLSSQADTANYDFVDAALNQQCRLVLTKTVSPTVTLDTQYATGTGYYLGTRGNPPENGINITDLVSTEAVTD